jgi:hypothetical protein
MSTTPGSSPAARTLARELLEREMTGGTETPALSAALSRLQTRASGNLRRSLGEDGYNALRARAMARMHAELPGLKDLGLLDADGVHLNDIVKAIDGHGAAVVNAAFESLLAALVDILSDLIGADMVRNLLDHDEPPRVADRRRTP